MVLLRTIFVFFVVGLSMLVVFPFGIIIFLLSCMGLKRQMSLLTYKLARGWALVSLASTGCKLAVRGTENVPRTGGFCLVGNHNSILDIVLILATVGRPIGFIAKKELALIPFLNIWILLIGGLFIDRKNIRKAVSTINEGIGRIKSGGAMIIFPEGTRSKGQGLLPFKPGSLKLATKAGSSIVPMAITGSYEVFEKTGRVHPGPVSVSYAPAIATAEFSSDEKRSLVDQIYGVIDGMLKTAT
jgi:1-acyl-sn-glycerol-3-phosphate acyltransferase